MNCRNQCVQRFFIFPLEYCHFPPLKSLNLTFFNLHCCSSFGTSFLLKLIVPYISVFFEIRMCQLGWTVVTVHCNTEPFPQQWFRYNHNYLWWNWKMFILRQQASTFSSINNKILNKTTFGLTEKITFYSKSCPF